MPAQTNKRPWRVLVMGCGSIGTRHIQNLLALGVGRIIAYDPRPDRLRELQARFPIEIVERLEQAWAAQPTVAVITAPTSLHVPLAFEAAKRGMHLFIEKPLSDRLDDAVDRLIETVHRQQLVTLVGCNFRFHPGVRRLKALCQEGVLGRLIAARLERGQYLPDWHPGEDYREGYSARRKLVGGTLLDDIHELDAIRWLLGEVESVVCFAGKLSRLEIETEDTAEILLRFRSGAIGEIHTDYVQRVYSRTCQVIGEDGTARWDYTEGTVRWYSAAAREWTAISNPPGWQPNDMYVEEMRHFLTCLVGEEEPLVDVVEGRRTLEVALAAKASAETSTVVALRCRAPNADREQRPAAAVTVTRGSG